MWEEAVHLAPNFVPQLLGHVARSADGERIDAVRNADVEFFAHAVRWTMLPCASRLLPKRNTAMPACSIIAFRVLVDGAARVDEPVAT